jgi:sporulation protein YlmC with PRC-barrel domain
MKKDDSAAAPADQSQDQAATAPAGEKFLTEQASGEWMASSLIGSSVYNSADESLGDINDVVFNEDGSIKAVVIGVGGFLGIGEKSVAVDFKSLTKSTDANGNDKFVIDATKEELDAAPAFVTLVEKKRMEAAPPPAADTTAPAPAPEPAPAQ